MPAVFSSLDTNDSITVLMTEGVIHLNMIAMSTFHRFHFRCFFFNVDQRRRTNFRNFHETIQV